MAKWLAALGGAFLEGSKQIGRHREEKRIADAAELDRKRQLLQMALMEEENDLRKMEMARGRAKDTLAMAGPGGALDPAAAQIVREGGLGFRLNEQEAQLPSRQVTADGMGGFGYTESPGQEAGITVMPTAAEQFQLDEQNVARADRDRQQRFRSVVESPQFLAQPREKRQQIWTAAGYPGQVPETFDEQKQILDYQHGLEMERTRLMYPPDRFGGKGGSGAGAEQAAYGDERAMRTLMMVDELLGDGTEDNPGLVNNWTAGPMGAFGAVPFGPQHTLHNKLKALGANIAFSELTEMRLASPTGGALGNVSNVELDLLQNAMGAIQQTNDPAVLRQELTKVRDSVRRWQQAKLRYKDEAAALERRRRQQMLGITEPVSTRESFGGEPPPAPAPGPAGSSKYNIISVQ